MLKARSAKIEQVFIGGNDSHHAICPACFYSTVAPLAFTTRSYAASSARG